MEILFVTMTFPPKAYGGVTTVSYNMARALARLGHNVTVFTTDYRDKLSRISGTPQMQLTQGMATLYFLNASNRLAHSRLFLPLTMIAALRKRLPDFDIVHLHDFRSIPAVAVHYYAMKYGVPYILQAHGSAATFFQKGALKSAFDSMWGRAGLTDAAGLIATTPAEADQYASMGADRGKITIIPNGINTTEFATLPKRGLLRDKLGIRADEKVILFLGRLHRLKGLEVLIRALALLLREAEEALLLVVGPDDGYLSPILHLARQLGVEGRMRYLGPLYGEEKIQAFVDADLFVLPSHYEIFGVVVFEALMCGTPVLVSDSCGTAFLIRDKKLGFVAKSGNPPSMASAITQILRNLPEARATTQRARSFIEANLSWEILARQVEAVYERCAGRGSSSALRNMGFPVRQ